MVILTFYALNVRLRLFLFLGEKKPWDFVTKDLIPKRDSSAISKRSEEIEKSCEEFQGFILWLKKCPETWQQLQDSKHWTISDYTYKDGTRFDLSFIQ